MVWIPAFAGMTEQNKEQVASDTQNVILNIAKNLSFLLQKILHCVQDDNGEMDTTCYQLKNICIYIILYINNTSIK